MQKWWWLLIAFALIVGAAFGYSTAPLFEAVQQQEAYPKYADAAPQIAQSGKIPSVKPKAESVRYKTPCQQPQSRDESDLCAQWRAAEAAEQGVRDATSQTLANWVGIIGLLATLIVSARAAQHAAEAAEATREANRPWVEPEKPTDLHLSFTAKGIELSGDVGFINHGNSPATNVLVRAKLLVVPSFEEPETIPISGIELDLDQWEVEHSKRGKIAYPNKPGTSIVADQLPVDEIRQAEGDDCDPCRYFLIVGVSYRFARKKGRTVIAYLLDVKDLTAPLWPPYNVPENHSHRVLGANVGLTDILEGYAR